MLDGSTARPYQFLRPLGKKYLDALRAFTRIGAPTEDDIKALRYKLVVRDEDGDPLVHSDAPWAAAGLLVVREPVRDALSPLLLASGRFVELPGHGGEYHAYYASLCLDLVDWERSVADRLPTGAVILPRSLVLKGEPPLGVSAFRVPELNDLFVTDDFVERWNDGGWEGLAFADLEDPWGSR